MEADTIETIPVSPVRGLALERSVKVFWVCVVIVSVRPEVLLYFLVIPVVEMPLVG